MIRWAIRRTFRCRKKIYIHILKALGKTYFLMIGVTLMKIVLSKSMDSKGSPQ